MRTINRFAYRATAYTMMTDRSILQSYCRSSQTELSFESAASLAGVLRDISAIIIHISPSIVDDDTVLSSTINRLLDMYEEQRRISGDVSNWLDTALFNYQEMIFHDDPSDYECNAREWQKVLYIVRRRVLA